MRSLVLEGWEWDSLAGAFAAVRIRPDLTGRPRFVMAERGAAC